MTGQSPPYRDVAVGKLLTHLAESLPDYEALVYWESDLRLTFSQLEAESRLVGRGLIALGVERGERVTVWATNVPEWIVLQFALAKIGAILVTANTALRKHEIDYLLRQSQSATVISIQGFKDVDYVNALSEIGAAGDLQSPYLKRAIYIGDDCPRGFTAYQSVREIADSISEGELVARENQVGPDDVINMQYTSGTTGFPKGVMLSSRNIVNNGYWLGQGLGYSPQDRLSLCVPLFHCFGCVIGVLGAYTHGACLCPIEYFDPLKVLQTIERERCSSLYGVPTMFLAEMEHPQFKSFNLSSLRTGVMAGALCPEPLMKRAIDEMNLHEITIIYGLTEASPGITQTLRDDTIEHRTRTVGKVLPEMEVKIVDPISRLSLVADQTGELCVRGYNVMKGYYNNPEATGDAIDENGWLHSGDQAIIDADGYVRITGRIKDIIIRGGENIAPKEIEDLLRDHHTVIDAYVYAVSSEFFGEEVAASVKLKQGMSASEDDLRDFCQEKIARFKVPRYFRFVDDFPMTASGKIQKFKLREMHEERLRNKRKSTEQTEKE
ncbi:MAG: AMP-binding protein [Acidobacteria bacterium]|nr:AMP-binding protein [Acidobacteriota bacterium]